MQLTKKMEKIVNGIENDYKKNVRLPGAVTYNAKEEIETEIAYINSEYVGEYKGDLNWRMFQNIVNQFIDVELRATAIKRKILETISLDEDYVFSMIFEKELHEEFDRIKLSNVIRDFQKSKRVHGNAAIKVLDRDEEYLQIPDFSLLKFNAQDIENSPVSEPFELTIVQLDKKRGIWNDEAIDALIKHADKNKETSCSVEEIFGEFKESDITGEVKENEEYKMFRIVVGRTDKLFLLDHYEVKDIKDHIRFYWRERRPGNLGGKGISVIKEVEPEQIAINEVVVNRQEAEAITSKVGVRTNLPNIPGVLQLNSGFVVEADSQAGEYFDPVVFNAPQVNFQNTIDAYFQNAQRKVAVHESNSGEDIKAGTTYRGQALQNSATASHFDYMRGIDADDVVEFIWDFIVVRMVKRINKDHELSASYSPKQLAIIDQYILNRRYNEFLSDLAERAIDDPTLDLPDEDELDAKMAELQENQRKKGMRRSVFIPKGFINMKDVKKKVRIIASSEQDDVQERIDELLSTMERMDPGDPSRVAMQQEIMELSGVSPAQFLPQTANGAKGGASQRSKPITEEVKEVLPEGQQ